MITAKGNRSGARQARRPKAKRSKDSCFADDAGQPDGLGYVGVNDLRIKDLGLLPDVTDR